MTRRPNPGERRSLSHVGGPSELAGDPDVGAKLALAVDVPTSVEVEEMSRAHVHGFHTYPARMHPLTARRLVESFSAPGERVLDPFAGSGTVLVEARLAGREAIGVDANPLAVRLASLKIEPRDEAFRARLLDGARAAARTADERRLAKTGASRRYPHEDLELLDPHVLLELDGLRVGIAALEDDLRPVLELVLSSILVKVGKRGSETSERGLPRRIAAGYPSKLFTRKTEELTRSFEAVFEPLARGPRARAQLGDARRLDGVESDSATLIATSPPYPGNYDYVEHHLARLRWLGLDIVGFDRAEIGARRKLEKLGPVAGLAQWREELGRTMAAMRRVLRFEGRAVLLLADSVVAGRPVFADDLVRALAPETSLRVEAVASQLRPHFHGPTARAFSARPRREHAIALRPIETPRGPEKREPGRNGPPPRSNENARTLRGPRRS